MSGLVITAIVIAGVVTQGFLGNRVYFGWLDISTVESPHQVSMLLTASLACGVAGGLFSRMVLEITATNTRIGAWRKAHPFLFAAGCGLLVAVLGWGSTGATFGTGYLEARQLLSQTGQLPWYYGLDKFLATLASFASGIPGGIFAPSLAIGAGLGQNLHVLVGGGYMPGMTNVLCMAGFLAAVTQTPITAFVIVLEMVNGYGLVIDLMIVTLLASGVSRVVCPPLYRTLALRYLRETVKATVPHATPARSADPGTTEAAGPRPPA
jgi:H+/Cl- antiporter ClcA